jgi:hypothetical protein
MGTAANQIEQHIRRERYELEANFNQLEAKVKDAFDWKSQFQQHPGAVLGAALVGGALLAVILPKPRNGSRAYNSEVPSRAHSFLEDENPYTNRAQMAGTEAPPSPSRGYSAYTSKTRSASNDVWDTLKAAAVGLASTRLSEYIEEFVPGFTEQYRKAASGKLETPFSSNPSRSQGAQQYSGAGAANGTTDHESHS